MANLQLRRSFQNANFDSWKIGSDFVSSKAVMDFPGSIYESASDALDYVHMRASVLRNHLLESQGRLFAVTRAEEHNVAVYEISGANKSEPEAAGLELLRVAVLPVPAAADTSSEGAVESTLHCSLAVVAATAGTTETAARNNPKYLLVSTGQGDLVLAQQQADGADGVLSTVVFPLRPRPPAVGARPFTTEAAWVAHTGHIRCVLAAISSTSSSSSSSHRSALQWVCDTWLVTLSVSQQHQQQQQGFAAAGPDLQVIDCQLLLVSKSPPAAVVGCAAECGSSSSSETVMIVSEPAVDEDELPKGFFDTQASVSGAAAAAGTRGADHLAPAADADTTAAAAAAAAAAADVAAAVGADEDLDDMDIDPRTLRQAAARLAQYTSETQQGDLPQQQWTDVFKESGPGDLGSGESDPAVDIMLFTTAAAAAGVGGSSSSSSTAQGLPGKMRLQSTVSCGPHRLLTVQDLSHTKSNKSGVLYNSSDSSSSTRGVLLGLTDDVDCAVVAATLQQQQQGLAASNAAAGTSSTAAAAEGLDGAAAVSVCHTASLPALAYVVAGKTQRRHLLLGGSGSPVCAVLVEGQKYAYLYGQVPPGATHGQQQIVDMELPSGRSIMGARLLDSQWRQQQQQQRHNASQTASAGDAGQRGSDGDGTSKLLLLTQTQLLCYTLRAPH